jgi:hypothetical protein
LVAPVCLERYRNDDGYQQQLEQLKIEHRDLDDSIRALSAQTLVDQLQIARLKKKKLVLKDRIMRLEDQLIPDIIA